MVIEVGVGLGGRGRINTAPFLEIYILDQGRNRAGGKIAIKSVLKSCRIRRLMVPVSHPPSPGRGCFDTLRMFIPVRAVPPVHTGPCPPTIVALTVLFCDK